MKKSGFQLTLISVLVIATSIGLAAILSGLTPKGDIIPPEKNSSQSEETDKEIQDSSGEKPSDEPSKGGIKGGNKDAIRDGRLPGDDDKDVNSDPNKFWYQINTDVVLDTPEAEGNIMVENNPGNACPMQLCYYLEDTEELIYVSPMIAPDEHVEKDILKKKLKKGEYKINAVISVYDEETTELKTTFHEEVQLTVNQKFLGIF